MSKKLLPVLGSGLLVLLALTGFTPQDSINWKEVVIGDWYEIGHTYIVEDGNEPIQISTRFEIAFTPDNMYVYNAYLGQFTRIGKYNVQGNQMFFIDSSTNDTLSRFRILGNELKFKIRNSNSIYSFTRYKGPNGLSEFIKGDIDSLTYRKALQKRIVEE
ncbi:hypothetical protein [Aureicoccus marinus]|uniref:DUF4488 domain-containing protein n=1 Tax=Aureicoccus marinus TaxID=754435 RepID=A0A2S7T6N3_9FLAO|nr:hypothetical protein [Aureicoccus marinus]PQJ15334.1 hypothetical protein BST99_05915 [Aureicoccus marinus]